MSPLKGLVGCLTDISSLTGLIGIERVLSVTDVFVPKGTDGCNT